MADQTDFKFAFPEEKDPDAVLSYKFDFAPLTNNVSGATSDWLDTTNSETISSVTVTAESGITKDSSSITDSNTSVTVTLSGGTAGQDYEIECKPVTSTSLTVVRTGIVRVRQR
jgi:hypothetical protein